MTSDETQDFLAKNKYFMIHKNTCKRPWNRNSSKKKISFHNDYQFLFPLLNRMKMQFSIHFCFPIIGIRKFIDFVSKKMCKNKYEEEVSVNWTAQHNVWFSNNFIMKKYMNSVRLRNLFYVLFNEFLWFWNMIFFFKLNLNRFEIRDVSSLWQQPENYWFD